MKILNIGMLLLLAAALPGTAQQPSSPGGGKSTHDGDDNCGLLYGKGHSLTFCAPDDWRLDNGIMNDEGIYAVFYPNGSNWQQAKDSGTFMYINVVSKAPDFTIKKMMADDASDARQNAPKAVVKEGEPIKIGDISAPVQRFAPGGFDRYEAVAYISEEKVLVMFIISSKDKGLFDKDYSAFVRLVQSYKFLSSDVTIQHK